MSTHNICFIDNKKDISIFRIKKAPYLLLWVGESESPRKKVAKNTVDNFFRKGAKPARLRNLIHSYEPF